MDSLYASTDGILDGFGDTLLANFTPPGSIAVGGTYSHSYSFTIPANYHGNLYFIVQVDSANSVPEGPGEADNLFTTPAIPVGLRAVTPTEIKDDGDFGFQLTGPGWALLEGRGFQGATGGPDHHVHTSGVGDGPSNVARWSINTPPGTYEAALCAISSNMKSRFFAGFQGLAAFWAGLPNPPKGPLLLGPLIFSAVFGVRV